MGFSQHKSGHDLVVSDDKDRSHLLTAQLAEEAEFFKLEDHDGEATRPTGVSAQRGQYLQIVGRADHRSFPRYPRLMFCCDPLC